VARPNAFATAYVRSRIRWHNTVQLGRRWAAQQCWNQRHVRSPRYAQRGVQRCNAKRGSAANVRKSAVRRVQRVQQKAYAGSMFVECEESKVPSQNWGVGHSKGRGGWWGRERGTVTERGQPHKTRREGSAQSVQAAVQWCAVVCLAPRIRCRYVPFTALRQKMNRVHAARNQRRNAGRPTAREAPENRVVV